MESHAAYGSQDQASISTDRVADAVVVTVDGEIDILTGQRSSAVGASFSSPTPASTLSALPCT